MLNSKAKDLFKEYLATLIFVYISLYTSNVVNIILSLSIIILVIHLTEKDRLITINPMISIIKTIANNESIYKILPDIFIHILGAFSALLIFKFSNIKKYLSN